MKKLLTFILLASMLASCMDRPILKVHPGDPLPDMDVTLSDGTAVTRDSLIQGESLIAIFNLQEPDCGDYLSAIHDVVNKCRGLSVCLVNIAEPGSVIREYWHMHNFTLPYATPEDLHVFGINPGASRQLFLLCRWGIIFNVWDSRHRLTENELLENIQSHL